MQNSPNAVAALLQAPTHWPQKDARETELTKRVRAALHQGVASMHQSDAAKTRAPSRDRDRSTLLFDALDSNWA
jgi:hypothetical protein